MSSNAMTQMLEKANSDEEFAKGLIEAVGSKSGPEAISAVVSYGNDNGFSVTADDAVEMRTQILAQADGEDGDLDDADLENVAGGVGIGKFPIVDIGKPYMPSPVNGDQSRDPTVDWIRDRYPENSLVKTSPQEFFKQW